MEIEITDAESEMQALTRDALARVQAIFDDYVIFPTDEARDAVVLWVAHAHVVNAFESTPRLSVFSSEPGSGKSRVLEVTEWLVPRPMYGVSMTPGTLWRAIEHDAPTLLFDEVDTVFGRNGSSSSHSNLRAIINAGHRSGATIPRCVGAEDVKHFRVYAPVAMAGLGDVPETIHSRSIRVQMRKRRAGQEVRPFRPKFAQDALKRARTELEAWALDAEDVLEFSAPEMPVSDRDADVWEPLFAIAELAGDEWSERVKRACEELNAQSSDAPMSPGMRLLTDIHEVWSDGEAVMLSREILDALYAIPGSGYSRDTLKPRSLATILSEYDVSPANVRTGERVGKGYRREDLEQVWREYKII